jgi:hypothetical protein
MVRVCLSLAERTRTRRVVLLGLALAELLLGENVSSMFRRRRAAVFFAGFSPEKGRASQAKPPF